MSKLHQVLEIIENANLPEGKYLEICKLLKEEKSETDELGRFLLNKLEIEKQVNNDRKNIITRIKDVIRHHIENLDENIETDIYSQQEIKEEISMCSIIPYEIEKCIKESVLEELKENIYQHFWSKIDVCNSSNKAVSKCQKIALEHLQAILNERGDNNEYSL